MLPWRQCRGDMDVQVICSRHNLSTSIAYMDCRYLTFAGSINVAVSAMFRMNGQVFSSRQNLSTGIAYMDSRYLTFAWSINVAVAAQVFSSRQNLSTAIRGGNAVVTWMSRLYVPDIT